METLPTVKIYKAFLCDCGREYGSYECYGNTYAEAAVQLTKHWNKCSRYQKYGSQWGKSGYKESGMPKEHQYLTDEIGNTLLLVGTKEVTTFRPNL